MTYRKKNTSFSFCLCISLLHHLHSCYYNSIRTVSFLINTMLHFIALSSMLLSQSISTEINCSGANQCFNDSISCPPDNDCNVQCLGESSCSFSIVECPTSPDTSCSIYCDDKLSCNGMIIHAENVSILQITSTDNTNALDDVNIYSIHNEVDTIHILCDSQCWTDGRNPVIHYGSDHSMTCIISSSLQSIDCLERPQLLIAQELSTVFPVPIGTDLNVFESILIDNNTNIIEEDDNGISGIDHSFNNALFFILIGLCGGFLISILCGVPCCYYWTNRSLGGHIGSGGHPMFEIKVNDKTPVIRPQRFKLTPSLQKLSPPLEPSSMELNALGHEHREQDPSPSPIHLGSDWKPTHSVSPSSQTGIILSNLNSMGSLPSGSAQMMSPYSIPSPQELPGLVSDFSNSIFDLISVKMSKTDSL